MDNKSKTAPQKVTAAQRRDKALRLRIGGYKFQEIGDEFGITRQAAHGLVKTALKELNEKTMESAAELKRIQTEQLDTMTYAIWGQVLAGDLGAVAAMDRIQKRRAALEGMDAPKKLDHTSGGEKMPVTDPAELTKSITILADVLKDTLKK